MKLTKVTFTGVDERTDVKRLVQLQKRFPFVEFGVLLSYDWQFNGNRFVDPLIISVLRDRELSLSAHFCGQAALDVAAGKKFIQEIQTRMQIKFTGQKNVGNVSGTGRKHIGLQKQGTPDIDHDDNGELDRKRRYLFHIPYPRALDPVRKDIRNCYRRK